MDPTAPLLNRLDDNDPWPSASAVTASDLAALAREVAEAAFARGAELDDDDCFPDVEFAALQETGLLAAPLLPAFGGAGLGVLDAQARLTLDVLATIGWGSLPLGRLYEGHVNALKLIQSYGAPAQIAEAAEAARQGHVFGVWNTEPAEGLRLEPAGDDFILRGKKIFASGAGRIERPLVTARLPDGGLVMVCPHEVSPSRADGSGWRAQGMRASASGALDFSGLRVTACEIIGAPGDYHLQPVFSAGAWRFCAVQLGGIERVFDCAREHLRATGRGGDPHQLARMGLAAVATQGARHWVEAAAVRAEADIEDAEALVAFVNLTRTAVERAGLDVLEFAQRSVGLAGYQRTHPMERPMRDLATYLRQPAPDKALTEAAAYALAQSAPARDLWRRRES